MGRLAGLMVLSLWLAAPVWAADAPAATTCTAIAFATRLTADVLVNGRGPYNFLVDSSADSSVVGRRIAQDLRLSRGRPAILNGMTGREVIDRVKVDELTIGPTVVRGLELPVLSEADLGGDGLLGLDAFAHQRLVMNFEGRRITIDDVRVPATPAPGSISVTARRRGNQLILTGVRAAGVPVDAVIHTGSELSIGNIALQDALLGRNASPETVEVIGVAGGPTQMQVARIPELEFGSMRLRDVRLAFADAPPFASWGLSGQPALLLGTDVLERFSRASLDFREGKVNFQPRNCG